MCRFLLYKGSDEILLSKLILDPTHSILRQSFDSRLRLDTRRGQNNADGFGIGFYTNPKLGEAPCLFTSTTPAWNCVNLQRIATKTASHLIFAHVRATTEGSLSEDNCHPFTHGSLMWMHNGGLGGWKQIKRRLGQRLADKWFLGVTGGTDSEWAFALFLDTLERMGRDPSSQPKNGFGPDVLRKAMLKTIALINEMIDSIPHSVVLDENVDTRSLLNFAVTDGHSIICTRYVGSSSDEAASLYYSSGTLWETRAPEPGKHDYKMERSDKGADVVLVASEPLTFERENWVNVPTNSILTIHNQTVLVHPIKDQYYERNPYHRRSTAYVKTKGLAANENTTAKLAPPILDVSPSVDMAGSPPQPQARKFLGPTIPAFGITRAPQNQVPQPGPRSHAKTSLSKHIEASSASSHGHNSASNSGSPTTTSASPSSQTPPDIRSTTTPGPARQQPVPAQGNIKKKRASLHASDTPLTVHHHSHLPHHGHGQQETSPITPEPTRTEFGNPNKIAQYFPELTPLG
ncbi:nucleophile aminohydrolase [Rhypophila decipiens]|uniref:Nucleophile aminohydrolase n=1 Tax=Rhypophila decipiens TaxID=261697 RepID=A0AAN7BD54_9PEZI|nr:nucleophile aminohydrolase [Rhypophila decipiens]